jgi:hypothetical protein
LDRYIVSYIHDVVLAVYSLNYDSRFRSCGVGIQKPSDSETDVGSWVEGGLNAIEDGEGI